MIDWLEQIDRNIVLAINSWHSPFFDSFFWIVSAKATWIPLYLLLIFLAYRKLNLRSFLYFIGFAMLSVALADLISLLCFKNVFERFRPSHHALLTEILHFHKLENGDYYKGGMYGFVSSHAANFAAIASFVGIALKQHYPKLIFGLYAVLILVCYSRLYLGVHYLSDVFVGAIVGTLIGYVLSKLFVSRFS